MTNSKQVVLLQLITPQKTQTFDIDKSVFILGRGDTSAIPIVESGISREHLKVKLEDNLIYIQDLNSSNGTYVEGLKITPMEFIPIREAYSIGFGNTQIKIKLKILDVKEEINVEIKEIEKYSEHPPIVVDLSAFPKTEEDFKLSFKNVGLNLPRYKNANEHSQEIIKEAEYIKHSIIKSAEVYKSKAINEAKIQSQRATETAYTEYQKLIDNLLDETRRELLRLKTETEIMLDEKRLQANDEIQNLWKEHRELIRKDRDKQFDVIEKENKIKLELSIEKMKSDMFSERNRLITDAENEILQKKRAYQVEFENEKTEHLSRIKLYNDELEKIQFNISESDRIYKENKINKDNSDIELIKVISLLKQEKENLDFVSKQYNDTLEIHKKIESELSRFEEIKNESQLTQSKAEKNIEELNKTFTTLSEKKEQLDDQIKFLSTALEDSKKKAKEEVEKEYKQLKEIESKKFDDYKSKELKELQKIRDEHSNSIKKFSVDLSQEIATKIELLSKKNGDTGFEFEKYFELINSVIQVKSAITTGSESQHTEQLDDWKKRKRKEDFSLMFRGFAAGFICIFLGNLVYKKMNTDPVQEEMARAAIERKQQEALNLFVPQKTTQYFDNYVEATIYTENFKETYLDDLNQQEWVNYATKYFLRQWKVEEERIIKLISNSKALVQTIDEAKNSLKKDRIKTDIEKLKTMEQENIKNQASLLGSNVRYEAYKKLEKEFFNQRLLRRTPANK